jgi:[ribosomal protein S5]-alanine N-acetyltransferase
VFVSHDITLETERLVLRPLSDTDLDALHRISNEPLVRPYLWDDEPVSMEQIEGIFSQSVREFAKKGLGLFGVRLRGEAELLGLCGFRSLENTDEIELAYQLSQKWWGRGFATEAARACLHYAFEEVGLERIVAGVEPQNVASKRVIEKLGMRYAGEMVPNQPEIPYFTLSRKDYRGRNESVS